MRKRWQWKCITAHNWYLFVVGRALRVEKGSSNSYTKPYLGYSLFTSRRQFTPQATRLMSFSTFCFTFFCFATSSSAFCGDSQEKFHARQVYWWRQLERMWKAHFKAHLWYDGGEKCVLRSPRNQKQFVSCRFGFSFRISTFSFAFDVNH